MSNLKVLSWLEFLNTVQGCFQPPQYSPLGKSFRKHKGGCLLCVLAYRIHLPARAVGGGDEILLVVRGCDPAWGHWEKLPQSKSVTWKLSQGFCPRYIPFISEFLTCGTHFLQLSLWRWLKKVHGLSAQWRNFSSFYSKSFLLLFCPVPLIIPLLSDSLGVSWSEVS